MEEISSDELNRPHQTSLTCPVTGLSHAGTRGGSWKTRLGFVSGFRMNIHGRNGFSCLHSRLISQLSIKLSLENTAPVLLFKTRQRESMGSIIQKSPRKYMLYVIKMYSKIKRLNCVHNFVLHIENGSFLSLKFWFKEILQYFDFRNVSTPAELLSFQQLLSCCSSIHGIRQHMQGGGVPSSIGGS